MLRKSFALATVLISFVIMGCSIVSKPKHRYVWPFLPDEPKIEYLGTYSGEKDLVNDSFARSFFGTESSQFELKNPQIAVSNGLGLVYVADTAYSGVVVYNFNNATVSMLGGEEAGGLFAQPTGVAVDQDGSVYVADSIKCKIFVFNNQGKAIKAIDLSSNLKSIGFIAIDKNRKRIIVPDPKGHKIVVVDSADNIITTIDKFESKREIGFNRPNAVSVGLNGEIIVADTFNARVVIFNSEGKYITDFGERGSYPGQFNIIQGVAVDSNGHIYLTDSKENRINVMNLQGQFMMAFGITGDSLKNIGSFNIPVGISIDQNDTIYIVEKYYKRFQKYQYLSVDYLAKNPIVPEDIPTPVLKDKMPTMSN